MRGKINLKIENWVQKIFQKKLKIKMQKKNLEKPKFNI